MDDLPPPPPYSALDPRTGPNEATRLLSPEPLAAPATAPATAPAYTAPPAFINDPSIEIDASLSALGINESSSPGSSMRGSVSSPLPQIPAEESSVIRDPVFIYRLTLKSDPKPAHFPFPGAEFRDRHTSEHDWSTFLNFLFPTHSVEQDTGRPNASATRRTSGSSAQLDQKVAPLSTQANGEMQAVDDKLERERQYFNQQYSAKKPGPEKKPPRKLSKSQPAPCIASSSRSADPGDEKTIQRRAQFQATLQEWNKSFFLPRSIHVVAVFNISSSKKMPINARSSKTGSTTLMEAITTGDLALIESLLLRGADPNIGPFGWKGPLFNAVDASDIPLVTLLLRYGASADNRPTGTQTPLMAACARSDIETAATLLRFGANPNTKPMGEGSALHRAALKSDIPVMKLLLAYGADPNDKMVGCETVLAQAIIRGDKPVIELLLAASADGSKRPWGGPSAVWRAAEHGDIATLQKLIAAKADLDSAPSGCAGPLGYAVEKGNMEVAELLLASGAKVNTKPWGGKSVLWTAAEKGDVNLVKKIASRGADLNDSPGGTVTALGMAVERSVVPIVEVLLECGADTEAKPWGGVTPLWKAADKGDTQITSMLLAKGAKVDGAGSGMPSPLFQAVVRGDTAMVQILLDAGANVDKKSSGYDTPLYTAISKGTKEIRGVFLRKIGSGTVAQRNAKVAELRKLATDRGDGSALGFLDGLSMLNY